MIFSYSKAIGLVGSNAESKTNHGVASYRSHKGQLLLQLSLDHGREYHKTIRDVVEGDQERVRKQELEPELAISPLEKPIA